MLELPVAAARSDDTPTVLLDQMDRIADFDDDLLFP
jgi:hypothetical protein